MNQISPEKIQNMFEQTTKVSMDAWKMQADYFGRLVKRNGKALTALAGAGVSSLKEMGSTRTLSQAFESNRAFEESAREEFTRLYEDNCQAWQDLQENLKAIYEPALWKSDQPTVEKVKEAKTASRPKKAA